jgi:hypothetical protein
MSEQDVNSFNDCLAHACQASGTACCKKGQVFLPLEEYQRLVAWLRMHSADELESFESRCTHHDSEGFVLYDQLNACQFLTSENLCRLHTQGVKPSECFWWPFHVYVAPDEALEIRVSTTCCDGYKNCQQASGYIAQIEKEVRGISAETIRAFRRVYGGSYGTNLVKRL